MFFIVFFGACIFLDVNIHIKFNDCIDLRS